MTQSDELKLIEALQYYADKSHWLRGGNIFLPTKSMYQPVGGSWGVAERAIAAWNIRAEVKP